MYTCPMHPEIQKDRPGSCPKCGMKLILESEAHKTAHAPQNELTKNYTPLFLIIGLILLTAGAIALRDLQTGTFSITSLLSNFMIGAFLVFGGFKLIDLKGFAQGYSTYDLLAKKFISYGYIYPFIELFFAFAMILNFQLRAVLWAELIVMVFSGVGVALKLLKKEKIECVCLGTILKVPLSTVTLVEDFGMAALAALMLVLL